MNRATAPIIGSCVFVLLCIAVAGWIFPMAGPHDWSKQCVIIATGIVTTMISMAADYRDETASLRLSGAALLVAGAVVVVLTLRLDDRPFPWAAIFYGGWILVAAGILANLLAIRRGGARNRPHTVRQAIGTFGTVLGFVLGLLFGAW